MIFCIFESACTMCHGGLCFNCEPKIIIENGQDLQYETVTFDKKSLVDSNKYFCDDLAEGTGEILKLFWQKMK